MVHERFWLSVAETTAPPLGGGLSLLRIDLGLPGRNARGDPQDLGVFRTAAICLPRPYPCISIQ